MKICIIGCNGHWNYAEKEIVKCQVVGVLPGFDGEDMQGVLNILKGKRIETKLIASLDELFELKPEIAIINTKNLR